MINILFYVSGFAEISGGIETYILNAMNYFKNDKNIHIKLLTRYCYKKSEFYYKFCREGHDVDSLDIQHLNFQNMYLFKKKLVAYLRKEKIDVLHIHGTDEPFIATAGSSEGISKIILHSHTPGISEDKISLIKMFLKNISRRNNIKHSNIIIGCSENVLTVLPGIERKKHFILNNSIDTQKFQYREKNRTNIRNHLKINGNEVIGHVGRFSKVKNHVFILDIFEELVKTNPTARLVLVGNGEEYEGIRQLSIQKNINDQVLFLGERTEIPELLSAFDIFILPSLFEGMSISLLEAQACGLPCIISDTISKDNYVTDLVKVCSFKDDKEKWCNIIQQSYMNKKNTSREKYAEIVLEKGYDSSTQYNSIKDIWAGDYENGTN